MAHKLAELRAKHKTFKDEADGIFAAAESQTDGELTNVQEQRLASIKGEILKLDGEIDAEIAALSPGGNQTATAPTDTRTPAEAEAAERKRSADIMAACAMAGKIDKASGFITSGKSLSEVVGVLQSERANDSDKNQTNAGNPTRHGKAEASWDKAVAKHNQSNGFK
ncbi:hypothetical protein [Rhizobium leguminosarum]|uniref:hypothetical protein n=1 Tax=Rhizobium leguminosarum TaxID=384 RepID=UPI00037BCCC2|nr:hypothetical protein [Rhizobium leguminosarum]